jgi:hypothetical protein
MDLRTQDNRMCRIPDVLQKFLLIILHGNSARTILNCTSPPSARPRDAAQGNLQFTEHRELRPAETEMAE